MLHVLRDRRRRRLIQAPFPEAWVAWIDRNVQIVRGLAPEERAHLQDLVKVFVAEKHFEGCGGLAITDEMKVTIAAQACLLLLNLRHDFYSRLVAILVYPEGFRFEQTAAGPGGTVLQTQVPVMGLSSTRGVVVLSWPDVQGGGRHSGDGNNVVLHEFAHQLDQLDGAMDGAPALDTAGHYREWAQVLGREYSRLQDSLAAGKGSIIGPYAATKPVEFFAVVTELFFERPRELRAQHPELYEEFRRYYRQDPAGRESSRSSGSA